MFTKTRLAVDDGWIPEDLDAWTPTGDHLGTVSQLRVPQGRA